EPVAAVQRMRQLIGGLRPVICECARTVSRAAKGCVVFQAKERGTTPDEQVLETGGGIESNLICVSDDVEAIEQNVQLLIWNERGLIECQTKMEIERVVHQIESRGSRVSVRRRVDGKTILSRTCPLGRPDDPVDRR